MQANAPATAVYRHVSGANLGGISECKNKVIKRYEATQSRFYNTRRLRETRISLGRLIIVLEQL